MPKKISSNSSFEVKNRLQEESGAIVVLAAIAAVAILAMVGLLIDSAVLSSSKTELEQATDFAALQAAEAYSRSADLSEPDRVAGAAQVASQSLNTNVASNLGARAFSAGDASWGGISPAGEASENGTLTPGTWYFTQPNDPNIVLDPNDPSQDPNAGCQNWLNAGLAPTNGYGSTTPCPCPGGWNGPCFQPVVPDSPNSNTNAFQLEVRTDDGDGVRALFGGLFDKIGKNDSFSNGGGVTLGSRSTVSLIPRRILFLIDLSPSVVAESHPRQQDASAPGLPYTFSAPLAGNEPTDGADYGRFDESCAGPGTSQERLSPHPISPA